MYKFKDVYGYEYSTIYSPLEISKLNCFDAIDTYLQNIVIFERRVDYKSFYFVQN